APPAMMLSRPASAPSTPPLTGASTSRTPSAASSVAHARTSTALTVLITTSTGSVVPAARHPARSPSGRSTTSRTCGRSGSMTTTTGRATWAGVDATVARGSFPATACAFAAVRFHSATSYPAASRFRAIGAPIGPVPTNPIDVPCILASTSPSTPVRRRRRRRRRPQVTGGGQAEERVTRSAQAAQELARALLLRVAEHLLRRAALVHPPGVQEDH